MTLEEQLRAAFGQHVAHVSRLQGGDLSEVFDVTLLDGAHMAVKRGPMVDVEARMLQAMLTAGASVPGVLHVDGSIMCLQWLDEAPGSDEGWRDLGRALTQLHRHRGTGFGWPEDYAFGAVPIRNDAADTWAGFWAERRLLPFLPELPTGTANRIERLVRRLDDLLPRAPTPALLHGDLWSGNVMFTAEGATMIDPACYHGHSEVDLAMLELFGAPHPAFFEGFGPIEPGRRERRPIYQLWPALVHLRLFGAGYLGMVNRLLDEAGA